MSKDLTGKDGETPERPEESLDYWRKKLAEETLAQFHQQESSDQAEDQEELPQLNELARKLDQLKFNIPPFEESDTEGDSSSSLEFPTFHSPQQSGADTPALPSSGRAFQRSTTQRTSTNSNDTPEPVDSIGSQGMSINKSLKDRARELIDLQKQTPIQNPLLPQTDSENDAVTFDFKSFSYESGSSTASPAGGDKPESKPSFSTKFQSEFQHSEITKPPGGQSNAPVSTFKFPGSQTMPESLPVDNQKAVQNVSQPVDNQPPAKRTGVPYFVFMLMLIYSCLATLLCVHFFLEGWVGNPKELESLPDLVPEIKDGQAVYHLVPEGRKVPAGHTLALGESRRFGNIIVTASKVTYGPVEFEHYSGDARKTKPATEPAFKLWLHIRNVSAKQTFAPLDRTLLLTKVTDRQDPALLRSNHFLSKSQEKSEPKNHLLVYDLPIADEWNFKNHKEDFVLAPGESSSIYIPTQPGSFEEKNNNMIWRVHLRKGYHQETHHGVTTLVEVKFNTRDVINEVQTSSKSSPDKS